MTLSSKAMSAFAAVSVAAGLGLGSDWAEARDHDRHRFDHNRHYHHDRGHGHLTHAPRLNRGLDPHVLLAPRPYYYAPPPALIRPPVHHHGYGHGGHVNIWPWVAGAALLGVFANAYSTPAYSETIIIQDSQVPLLRKDAAQVCFNGACSPQTGSIEINGKVCQETIRGGVSHALCPNGEVFVPR